MAKAKKQQGAISEIAIVDVFTKLIFDADSSLNESEQMIIDGLCLLDCALAGAARREISEYLRAMTIEEMIAVVNNLKAHTDQQGVIAANKTAQIQPVHH